MRRESAGLFRARVVILVMSLMMSALAAEASAQTTTDVRGLHMKRSELEAALASYEQAASASGYSGEMRARARREAELIRARLRDGDFQVGDRIILRIEGEDQIPDTVVVEPQQVISLPQIGNISLAGVLRSELQDHITTELSRYIREPRVTADALIRLGILGAVSRPGFFVLPSSLLMEDALMMAGGPSQNAELDKVRVERGDDTVWEDDDLQEAMLAGRTLDQLSLRAGDRIIVPEESGSILTQLRSFVYVVPPLIYLATRIF